MAGKHIKCRCGCDIIYVSAADKNPKTGFCADCRADVELGGTELSVVEAPASEGDD